MFNTKFRIKIEGTVTLPYDDTEEAFSEIYRVLLGLFGDEVNGLDIDVEFDYDALSFDDHNELLSTQIIRKIYEEISKLSPGDLIDIPVTYGGLRLGIDSDDVVILDEAGNPVGILDLEDVDTDSLVKIYNAIQEAMKEDLDA